MQLSVRKNEILKENRNISEELSSYVPFCDSESYIVHMYLKNQI